MKATELMIGEWVHLHPDLGNFPYKIVELRYNGILVKRTEDSACAFVGDDSASPIPLTSEILEKNGWEVYKASNNEPMYHTLHLPQVVMEYYWFVTNAEKLLGL